jgi:pyridoxal phosphate enzyme (YggS family)
VISSETIKRNLEHVQGRIEAAAHSAGRSPDDITLVVVTKGHPLGVVEAAVEAGVRILGENYAREGLAKMQGLGAGVGEQAQSQLQWHMIGHVQSRKADIVAEHFHMLHSLDSVKLARRLDRFAGERGRHLPVLLQVNVSGEASKYGWPAVEVSDEDALVSEVEQILELPNLAVGGLMTIPPIVPDPERVRPFFARTRELRDRLAQRFPEADWRHLSMGMSADFEAAILEGATLVRIGTAILGPRPEN